MTTYTVRAERWDGGWELHVEGMGVTQSSSLAVAEQQARDYIETVNRTSLTSDDSVDVVPSLGELSRRAERARQATREATAAQEHAAAEVRALVRELRASGLSVADVATIMRVSRGRVSELTS